jgi:hypothetical protein
LRVGTIIRSNKMPKANKLWFWESRYWNWCSHHCFRNCWKL